MNGKLRLLLWLRFRTLFRGRSAATIVALAVGLAFLVPIAVGGGVFTFLTTRWLVAERPDLLAGWTHLVLLSAYFLIVVMPVIGFGGSEFYDITKLFHLPVTHRTVFVAHAIGLLFGSTVLLLLPAMLGLVVALPGGAAATGLRLVALLLFLFHCVLVGQFLQLAMFNVLRSRRFRDLATVLGVLLWGGIFLGFRLLLESGASRMDLLPVLERVSGAWYLVPIPSYWVSSALAPGAGLPWLLLFSLGFLPLTALLVFLSASLEERAFFGELPPPRVRERRAAPLRGGAPELRGWLGRIPGDVRAVAGNEIRLLRREPTVKTLLIHQFVFFLVPVGIGIWRTSGTTLGGLLEICLFFLLFVESNLVINLFGLESPGIAHLLATPIPRRRILLGKLLAYFGLWESVNLGLATAMWVTMAAVGRPLGTERVLGLYAGITAGLLVLLGIGAVVSPLAPARLGGRGRSALSRGQSNREGCVLALVRMLCLLVLVVLLLPVAALCYPWGVGPISLFSLPYAAGLLWLGIRLGTGLFRAREEELVLALSRSLD